VVKKSEAFVEKKPLLSWVFSSNLKILLVITVSATVFVRTVPLEMQKRIVNQAIQLKAFEMLLIYCGVYLAAVIIAGGFKFIISYLLDYHRTTRPDSHAQGPIPSCINTALRLFQKNPARNGGPSVCI
jgi:hypothetical protein